MNYIIGPHSPEPYWLCENYVPIVSQPVQSKAGWFKIPNSLLFGQAKNNSSFLF